MQALVTPGDKKLPLKSTRDNKKTGKHVAFIVLTNEAREWQSEMFCDSANSCSQTGVSRNVTHAHGSRCPDRPPSIQSGLWFA